MLTFLSRSLRKLLGSPALRAVPRPAGFGKESAQLPLFRAPVRLRLAGADETSDSAVVSVVPVGATAFVAGQGARIYSLDAFRPRGPHRPRAA